MYQPLQGHPYVECHNGPGPSGWEIHCRCRACGATMDRACNFPARSPVWIAKFAATHHHNDPQLRWQWVMAHDQAVRQARAQGA